MAAILTYHSLDPSRSVLSTPPDVFALQMRILVERGVGVVPLSDLARVAAAGEPGPPAVAITFDDGFRSVYEHALPVLVTLGLPATVFLVTGYCGKTSAWPDQASGLAAHPLLDWPEIREMARAGMAFGSHTRSHVDLRRLAVGEIDTEMVASKRAIEDALGQPVDTFAYPFGAQDARVRDLARAHFALACGTTLGFVGARSDRFALERLDMYYFRRSALFRRVFSPEGRAYVGVRRGLRAVRRMLA